MAKEKLIYKYNINYKVIAISTHLKDYRVSFYINQKLDLTLEKVDDLIIDNKSKGTLQAFEQQYFYDNDSEFHYHLIHNKTNGAFFLPSLKKFDFVFIVKSENDIGSLDEIIKDFKGVDHFQIIYKVGDLSKKENSLIEKNILYTE